MDFGSMRFAAKRADDREKSEILRIPERVKRTQAMNLPYAFDHMSVTNV